MTEYWVSQGNTWCDYCKIYISSNATSIRTHELGTRHKDNVARKLAGIRKDNAAKEKERLLASKDLGRIENEAKKSYERDLAAMQRSSHTGTTSALAGRDAPHGQPDAGKKSSVTGVSVLRKEAQEKPQGSQKHSIQIHNRNAPEVSHAHGPSAKSNKGVASSLEVGKRKRVEKGGVSSKEEAAALLARESARKRIEEREKSLLGLFHGP